MSKKCDFYLEHEIRFLLFAPSQTAIFGKDVVTRMNHLICDANIEYENGAIVRTAFVTSFGGDVVAQTAPDLGRAINAAVEQLRREKTRSLPKYTYPDNIVTTAILQRWAHYGIDFQVRRGECAHVSKLDAQRESGKAIFGGGLLLSSQKAAERAAAERAAAHVWELSQREMEIVKALGT